MFDIYEHYGTLGLTLIRERMLEFNHNLWRDIPELTFINAISAECLTVLSMEAL